MDQEILEVLKDIRTEAKQTNLRLESLEKTTSDHFLSLEQTTSDHFLSLEQTTNDRFLSLENTTNVRFDSLEGRVGFLEQRVTNGFERLSSRLGHHAEVIDDMARRQLESELRLTTEVLSLADVTRDVRDLLARKLDDHEIVLNHEERLRSLEDRIADRDEEL